LQCGVHAALQHRVVLTSCEDAAPAPLRSTA
jgi:hypothetical protein